MILYVMLVGRYPFERPEDARLADMARTQRTIQVAFMRLSPFCHDVLSKHMPFEGRPPIHRTQRVLARDMIFPTNITPECRDLLDKLLTLDPKRRITVAQIQAHPW